MSVVLTRSPLELIGMNGAVSQKRRSARLSGDGNGNDSGENEPPAKKTKVNGATTTSTTTSVTTKQQDSDHSKAAPKKKRKEYTDEADDFKFARKGGKSKKDTATSEPRAAVTSRVEEASTATAKPTAPERETEELAPKTSQKKTRRRLPTTPEPEKKEKPVRRSKRLSNETEEQLPQPSPQRPSHAKSHANAEKHGSPVRGRPLTVEKKRKSGQEGGQEEKVMRIMLPFADTPVQRRNKEMRKGSGEGARRSSAGMRGKRASSVIDEGRGHEVSVLLSSLGDRLPYFTKPEQAAYPSPDSGPTSSPLQRDVAMSTKAKIANAVFPNAAMPHTEVPSSEFYKHISAVLTEPRRMRCLLGWCGTRLLPSKPSPPTQSTPTANLEFQALQAARIIQDELSHDLVNNGMLSDWFSRDESALPQLPLRKKPNPRNIANLAKAEELERELERLKSERAEWDDLTSSAASVSLLQDRPNEDGRLSPVRTEHLTSPQRAIFEQFQPSSGATATEPAVIQERMKTISNEIEFAIDKFAHGVHALRTTRETAERVAEKSLADAANVLDERERLRASDKGVGQMDALRGLARVLNAQQRR